jgi:hypothetical protein
VLGPLDERERHPINAVIEERKGQRRALAQLAWKKCETDGQFRVSACSTTISASGLRRLKIAQSLVIGKAISCRVKEQLHRDLG